MQDYNILQVARIHAKRFGGWALALLTVVQSAPDKKVYGVDDLGRVRKRELSRRQPCTTTDLYDTALYPAREPTKELGLVCRGESRKQLVQFDVLTVDGEHYFRKTRGVAPCA
jgi:hypothetical protein